MQGFTFFWLIKFSRRVKFDGFSATFIVFSSLFTISPTCFPLPWSDLSYCSDARQTITFFRRFTRLRSCFLFSRCFFNIVLNVILVWPQRFCIVSHLAAEMSHLAQIHQVVHLTMSWSCFADRVFHWVFNRFSDLVLTWFNGFCDGLNCGFKFGFKYCFSPAFNVF